MQVRAAKWCLDDHGFPSGHNEAASVFSYAQRIGLVSSTVAVEFYEVSSLLLLSKKYNGVDVQDEGS